MSGTRAARAAGRTGLGGGSPSAAPGLHPRPTELRAARGARVGETGPPRERRAQALRARRGLPWVWAAHSAASVPGRPLAPRTRRAGSLRSGCGLRSDQARRWRPRTVARRPAVRAAAPSPGARPLPTRSPRRSLRGRGQGHPRSRKLARPAGPRVAQQPAKSHLLAAAPPGRPGAAAAPLPARPDSLPADPGRRSASPRAGQSGRAPPAPRAASPPAARSPGAPLGVARGSVSRRETPAPEREGVGSDEKKGEQERGPKEGGGKDGERERRRKGARETGQKKNSGGRGCPGPGPFPVVGLASPSAAGGQSSPTPTPTPARRLSRG